MNYEVAKKLKDAGFPQKYKSDCPCLGRPPDNPATLEVATRMFHLDECDKTVYIPSLSEIIEACGEDFRVLKRQHNPDTGLTWWKAESNAEEQSTQAYASANEMQPINRKGSTPEEAVANLWLDLNKIERYG